MGLGPGFRRTAATPNSPSWPGTCTRKAFPKPRIDSRAAVALLHDDPPLRDESVTTSEVRQAVELPAKDRRAESGDLQRVRVAPKAHGRLSRVGDQGDDHERALARGGAAQHCSARAQAGREPQDRPGVGRRAAAYRQ